jgi:hypothetical protein
MRDGIVGSILAGIFSDPRHRHLPTAGKFPGVNDLDNHGRTTPEWDFGRVAKFLDLILRHVWP